MSLIKCPECKRVVSDKADICPKCCFPIKNYKPTQEEIDEQNKRLEEKKARKKRIKKWLIITVAIITSVCVICCGITIGYNLWYDYQEQIEYNSKYPLFTESSVLDADPYGLTNNNNIIGENISTILRGYAENEDYTKSIKDDCVVYTFPLSYDYPLGYDSNLVLYVTDEIIYKVEYTFRIERNKGYYAYRKRRLAISDAKSQLTDYYDVDPIYTGYNFDDGEYVIMTKDEFDSLPYENYFDVTFITWESEKGMAMLSFTNMFDEKDEYGAVTFTNDEIEKETYQDYTDKYNPTM